MEDMLANVFYGVLAVCAAMIAAVVGLEVVRRAVPVIVRREHNDVAGFIYAVVGIVYAVLLALVVIAVWEEHEAAKATVVTETNELAEVFWLAHRLPGAEGQHLQELAQSYARVVIEEEWDLMEQGRSSPQAWALLDEMRLGVHELAVDTICGIWQAGCSGKSSLTPWPSCSTTNSATNPSSSRSYSPEKTRTSG